MNIQILWKEIADIFIKHKFIKHAIQMETKNISGTTQDISLSNFCGTPLVT